MNSPYKYESEVPVGGLYENEYGAICWKVNYIIDENEEVRPVKIVIDAAPCYVIDDVSRYDFVLDVDDNIKVVHYYGLFDNIVGSK